MIATLERSTFETSRLLEFFTEKELTMQIGFGHSVWPIALVKELIDNSLDACESKCIRPHIKIAVEPDTFTVQDNGPGLDEKIIERSLDYSVRVSDKAHYISPTRGQLGNALKCIYAASYVVGEDRGLVEIHTKGICHTVSITLDRIAQAPRLAHVKTPSLVKNGTLVKVHWPAVASYLADPVSFGFYNVLDLGGLVYRYWFFNPHAAFSFDEGKYEFDFAASNPAWAKWNPASPTSPRWYTPESIRSLVAAYVANEQRGGRRVTVREFISEFAGLSGTAKQKSVTEAAGLVGASLSDLVVDGEVSILKVAALWREMVRLSRPVKPQALGVIGPELFGYSARCLGIVGDSIRYKKIQGESDSLPFVVEVCFGVQEEAENSLRQYIGLNWAPALASPFREMPALLGQQRVDEQDAAFIAVHLACPKLDFTDRGKGALVLPAEIRTALATAIISVTKQWRQEKRQADKLSREALARLSHANKSSVLSLKAASYEVMAEAYAHTSDNGRLPANARQLMYSARKLILSHNLTSGKMWKESSTFTQQYLPDFLEEHSELTARWDVVFDARGRLVEPHTHTRVDLGTLAVRRYVAAWREGVEERPALEFDTGVTTVGPMNRYKFALFVEKEGFDELWQAINLADRYDLAIMSTKGMTVTASRELVERLSERGVTILMLRDFDKAGFSIVETLSNDTRRYRFKTKPRIVDLGLRLDDVKRWKLEGEPVSYRGEKDPRENLRANGATTAECNYLVAGRSGGVWYGSRVELNAFTSGQMVEWLIGKLEAIGVKKVVPCDEVLECSYRRAVRLANIQKVVNEMIRDETEIRLPKNLRSRVGKALRNSSLAWDDVIHQIGKLAATE
jgi:DNA topoisomerase VI subunit B